MDHFLRFYPLNNLKNQNFEKINKAPGDIIILNKCTINGNHMMYVSWDMKRDGQKFLWFWTVFCSFSPLTTQKTKIFKNWKNHLEISSFYISALKIMIIMLYCSLNVPRNRCDCYFSFWAIFCPVTSLTAQKINIKKKKKEKNTRRYHHFRTAHQKSWSCAILLLRYSVRNVIVIFHFGLFFGLLPP